MTETPTTDDIRSAYLFEAWDYFVPEAEAEAQFNAWLSSYRAEVVRDAIAHIDSTPAVTWTGPGGVKERLLEFIDDPVD